MKKSFMLKSGQSINKETVDNAISSYITNDITLKGAFFLLDKSENESLSLSFAGLQKYTFGKIKDDVFYSCVDFVDGKGVKYDIDFFVRCQGANNSKVIEIIIHKINGSARYEWGETANGYSKQYPNKKKTVDIAASILKKKSSEDSLLPLVLTSEDLYKLENKADEQSFKLATEVYEMLYDKMKLTNDESYSLNILKACVKNRDSWDSALLRNNLFKAAHSMKIHLPSMSF